LHDDCYQTCNPLGGKKGCDDAFERCLIGICDQIALNEARLNCYSKAGLYSTGVDFLGTSAYLQRQHEVCVCASNAVAESASLFAGISQVVGPLPMYGWVLIGAAVTLLVIGIIFGVVKLTKRKTPENMP